VLDSIFKEAYKFRKGNIDFGSRYEGEFFEFKLECAKRFPYFHTDTISSLANHYIFEALYTKDISDVLKEYHSLLTNVIVEELSQMRNQTISGWDYDFNKITSIAPDRLVLFIHEDGLLSVMNDILAYLKFLMGDTEEMKKNYPEEFISDLSERAMSRFRKEKTLKSYYTKLHYMYDFIKN
jgi:hypothetical protein